MQQRREQEIVGAIDDGKVDRAFLDERSELLGDIHAAESGAEDDDVRAKHGNIVAYGIKMLTLKKNVLYL